MQGQIEKSITEEENKDAIYTLLKLDERHDCAVQEHEIMKTEQDPKDVVLREPDSVAREAHVEEATLPLPWLNERHDPAEQAYEELVETTKSGRCCTEKT